MEGNSAVAKLPQRQNAITPNRSLPDFEESVQTRSKPLRGAATDAAQCQQLLTVCTGTESPSPLAAADGGVRRRREDARK